MRSVSAASVRAAGAGLVLAGVGAVVGAVSARARLRAKMLAAISNLEQANVQAVRHARLLQAILDSSSDGIAVVDGQGESLLHNPAAQAILGALDDSGTERWQAHYGIYHPDGRTPFAADELPLVRALAGQSSEQIPMLIRNAAHPTGSVISVCAQPLVDPSGKHGAVAVFHDVTALRQHEADLASFAGIVAHDLKSPLTAIMGFTEIAQDTVADLSPAAVRMLERVLATSRRMDQLIDDLLSYASARESALDAVDVDLKSLVDEVITDRFATATLAPEVPAPQAHVGPLAAVHADLAMIRQLLNNLIGNALKYAVPGQPARLEVTATSCAPGWIRVEIADRGIGIPAGQHHAVFEDFHRAHPRADYAGTGLGLAICNRIIGRHGGQIGVRDNPGGGARFWFTLPTAQAPAAPNSPPQDRNSAPVQAIPSQPARH